MTLSQERRSAMDDDGKEPEDAAAEPARDAAQEEGAKLREVSEEELKRILAEHETWLETDGKEGEQADLSRTDLQGGRGGLGVGAARRGPSLSDADLNGSTFGPGENAAAFDAVGEIKVSPPPR